MPGTRLTIKEIAKRYHVSEMPVREALQRLQGEGLIELLPHRGSRVKVIDEVFMENIYDIRGVIEGLLICSCVGNIPFTTIDVLEQINKRLAQAIERNILSEVVTLNMEFHETIDVYKRQGLALRDLRG